MPTYHKILESGVSLHSVHYSFPTTTWPLSYFIWLEDSHTYYCSATHQTKSICIHTSLLATRFSIINKWNYSFSPTITDVKIVIQNVYLNKKLDAELNYHLWSHCFLSKWEDYIRTFIWPKIGQTLYSPLYWSNASPRSTYALLQMHCLQLQLTHLLSFLPRYGYTGVPCYIALL